MADTQRKIKRVKLIVDVLLEDGITPLQQQEVAANIHYALTDACNRGNGIAPASAETFTNEIRVFIADVIKIEGRVENGFSPQSESLIKE